MALSVVIEVPEQKERERNGRKEGEERRERGIVDEEGDKEMQNE